MGEESEERGRPTDRASERAKGTRRDSPREETEKRALQDGPIGLAHYKFYDWSFGPPGALTRMPTCKGRITVSERDGSLSGGESRDAIAEAD